MSEQKSQPIPTERLDANRVRIPRHGAMRVDGLVYVDETLFAGIKDDMCLQQVVNVATLPGIVKFSIGMPDIHWGYGFPIGGVAAFDPDAGVISPGGVGFDINCGVRLLRSDIAHEELAPHLDTVLTALSHQVPSGVGRSGIIARLTPQDYQGLLRKGAVWAVENGFGSREDLDHIEAAGSLVGADADEVSKRAKERGATQLGTLGSGNHFLEVQIVERLFDEDLARRIGLDVGQVCVSIHCGSRGLGHQTCDDFLGIMLKAARAYGIDLPDDQLCCAPVRSAEGQRYLRAMMAAANFAFANRQVITHQVRQVFSQVLKKGERELGLHVVYDVCHNIAKMETHRVDGVERELCVHRKGATRAFPPHHPEVPQAYRNTGQPVLIPGDMGRYSYVLVGTSTAYGEAFGSSCHGAGRLLSRRQAAKRVRGEPLFKLMKDRGVIVKAASARTLAEEMPEAYKDVAQVVRVVESAGLAKIVARLRPIGVVKG